MNYRPLLPLCTYSDVINIGLPSVGWEQERKKASFFLILVSEDMNCLEGSSKDWGLFPPAHPRSTRMYGVTHSIAFQAIQNIRNFSYLFFR